MRINDFKNDRADHLAIVSQPSLSMFIQLIFFCLFHITVSACANQACRIGKDQPQIYRYFLQVRSRQIPNHQREACFYGKHFLSLDLFFTFFVNDECMRPDICEDYQLCFCLPSEPTLIYFLNHFI